MPSVQNLSAQRQTERVLVQIYGITTVQDALAVDRLGPDHIGVVLDEGLPTWDSVDEDTACAIADAITSARVVALSLSTDPQRITTTADVLHPAIVHLARAHLMSTPTLTAVRDALAAELMVTVPITGRDSREVAVRLATVADYLLFDTAHPTTGIVGATGLAHDWGLSTEVARAVERPVILAGGLGPHNVLDAIEQVSPAGVDSETHTSREDDRRRKDLEKVETFLRLARA